jgi:decaprenylphospho-beta-D-ribofuranose 2-oxidase
MRLNRDVPSPGDVQGFNRGGTIADTPENGFPRQRCGFVSFDGGVRVRGELQRPDRCRFFESKALCGMSISRGAGLSYAAASFREGGLSVEHSTFNRILDFDGRTQTVKVEAGVSLFDLHKFLFTRGLFLATQPGHGRITVGGAIAADAHGKNHWRDGTFIRQVDGLTLFHPVHGLIDLDMEKDPDLFRLTCGGYGLTGHIVTAVLRATPIPNNTVEVKSTAIADLPAGVEQLLIRSASDADFIYSWHDFTTPANSFGRGFVYAACFAKESGGVQPQAIMDPPDLSSRSRESWRLPLFNRLTARLFNLAFYRKELWLRSRSRLNLEDALFPIHRKQFYFKLFGTPGFHECQIIIPFAKVAEYSQGIENYLKRRPMAITLASAKLFRGEPELLRFTGHGICLALNFPRDREAGKFLRFLDSLMISLGGIPNIIKDSRLTLPVVEACYPGLRRFRELLHGFDPKRCLRSELSERLCL